MQGRVTQDSRSVMEDSGPTSCAGGLGNHVNTSLTISAVLYRLLHTSAPPHIRCWSTARVGEQHSDIPRDGPVQRTGSLYDSQTSRGQNSFTSGQFQGESRMIRRQETKG